MMFKVGDEVLCVNNANRKHSLSIGKVYIISQMSHRGLLQTKDDNGGWQTFYPFRFIHNTPEAKADYMKRLLEEVG